MTPCQTKVERAYQRAMDIRDSTPGQHDHEAEHRYTRAYLRCYKDGLVRTFRKETRLYLKQLRKVAA